MVKTIILYAASNFITKLSFVLVSILLINILEIAEIGIWSVSIILTSLLTPMVCLNGASSIIREGSCDKDVCYFVYKKYLYIAIIIGSIIYLMLSICQVSKWIYYSVLISILESLCLLNLSFFRASENVVDYFLHSIIKFVLVISLIGFNFIGIKHDVYEKLLIYVLVLLFLFVSFWLKIYISNQQQFIDKKIDMLPILKFSIYLIPHGIFQWIISGSDKFVIKYMLGDEQVGIYSIFYNIASMLIIINTAIYLALPTILIKNYKEWKREQNDNKLIYVYTFASLILFALIILFFIVDHRYINIIKYYSIYNIIMVAILYISLYVLGLYYFFVNHLFYHKKSAIISISTFKASLVNLVTTIIFVEYLGIIGGAIGTLISYMYYLFVIRNEVIKLDTSININIGLPSMIFLAANILISLIYLVYFI